MLYYRPFDAKIISKGLLMRCNVIRKCLKDFSEMFYLKFKLNLNKIQKFN